MRNNATREENIQKPNLSAEEEKQLARKWRELGDIKAFHRLIESCIPLVKKIVRNRYANFQWVQQEDLIQEGCLGLTIAVHKFNPDLGTRLATYAVPWIYATIRRFLLYQYGPARIFAVRKLLRIFYGMTRARRLIEQTSKTEATPEAIAEVLNADPEQVRQLIFSLANPAISIDSHTYHEEDAPRLVEEALSTAKVEQPFAIEELVTAWQYIARRLDPQEQRILRDRVLAPNQKTLREIGEEFGVSRELIRQVEQEAIQKIKHAFGIKPS